MGGVHAPLHDIAASVVVIRIVVIAIRVVVGVVVVIVVRVNAVSEAVEEVMMPEVAAVKSVIVESMGEAACMNATGAGHATGDAGMRAAGKTAAVKAASEASAVETTAAAKAAASMEAATTSEAAAVTPATAAAAARECHRWYRCADCGDSQQRE